MISESRFEAIDNYHSPTPHPPKKQKKTNEAPKDVLEATKSTLLPMKGLYQLLGWKKQGLKLPSLCFYPLFELTSDSHANAHLNMCKLLETELSLAQIL